MNTPTSFPTYKAPIMQTPYMVMSLQANEAPPPNNLLAAGFSWITLAGFVVLPGTFTSLENSGSLSDSKGGQVVKDAIQNVSLLAIAGVFCFAGTVGSCWLWRKKRKNYVWLLARIFVCVLQSILNG
jgi:hypothetical protein